MSADAKVAKELVETLKDGRDGFASAAEKLRDSDTPETAAIFERFSQHHLVQQISFSQHSLTQCLRQHFRGGHCTHSVWQQPGQ